MADYRKIRDYATKKAKRMFDIFARRREALLDTAYEFYPLGVPGLEKGVEELSGAFSFDDDHKLLTVMPLQMLRKSASGFNSNLTSPARSWFKLQLPDNMVDGEASHEQLKALDALAQATEKTLAGSNAYPMIYKVYEHLMCFGFACMIISPDEKQVINCQTLRVGTYAFDTDAQGQVNAVARRFAWTPQQILKKFGEDNTPNEIKELCRKGVSKRLEIWNLIEPNPQGFMRRFDALEKDESDIVPEEFAYRSIYFLRGGCAKEAKAGVLRCTGYPHNPIVAPRLDRETGDIYGIGRCMELVHNAKGAQTFKADELRISGLRAQPPVVAGSDFKDGVKLGRGGVNITESGDQRSGTVTSIFTQLPDTRDAMNCFAESRDEIMDALYVDAFAVIDSQKNNPGVKTATEIEYLKTENLSKLGSIAITLNIEMLNPLIATVAEYALESGVSPLSDEDYETLYAGMEFDEAGNIVSADGTILSAVKIEYISQIALAQKAGALTSVQAYVRFCADLTAMNPNGTDNAMDNVDRDKTARLVSQMLGVPESVNRDPKEIEATRQVRKQAAAEAARREQTAGLVQAAKEIGSIPVDEAHAGGIVKGLAGV